MPRPLTRIFETDNISRGISLVLFIYPILLLSVRSGMSTCFVLLIVLAVIHLLSSGSFGKMEWTGGDLAFCAAMASLMVATLANAAYFTTFRLDILDNASRLLFAIPIYIAFRSVALSRLTAIQFGIPLGVFTGFLTSIFFPSIYSLGIQGTYFLDPAQFAGAILVLGFLSAAAINWDGKDAAALLGLKVAALAIAAYCGMRSGERGIWIVIPVLALIVAFYRMPQRFNATLIFAGVALVTIVIFIAGYLSIPHVAARVKTTLSEIDALWNGNLETSAGQRLQIWKAGWEIIRDNPIFGVGPYGVSDHFRSLEGKGQISPAGLQAALSQIHNEILSQTIRLGLFGLIGILAVYFVPLVLFVRAAVSAERVKRIAALMGILIVTSYFMLGLTIEALNIKMVASFYAATVATLLAVARHAPVRSPLGQ